ncbi:MAG: hypothetical protein ACTSXG_02100 [Alphaproteobacteria bacterium]
MEQNSLFATPLKPKTAYRPQKKKFPNVTIVGALDKTQVYNESVYWLRILENQYIRSLDDYSYKFFVRIMLKEAFLKSGKMDPIICVRDALLERESLKHDTTRSSRFT